MTQFDNEPSSVPGPRHKPRLVPKNPLESSVLPVAHSPVRDLILSSGAPRVLQVSLSGALFSPFRVVEKLAPLTEFPLKIGKYVVCKGEKLGVRLSDIVQPRAGESSSGGFGFQLTRDILRIWGISLPARLPRLPVDEKAALLNFATLADQVSPHSFVSFCNDRCSAVLSVDGQQTLVHHRACCGGEFVAADSLARERMMRNLLREVGEVGIHLVDHFTGRAQFRNPVSVIRSKGWVAKHQERIGVDSPIESLLNWRYLSGDLVELCAFREDKSLIYVSDALAREWGLEANQVRSLAGPSTAIHGVGARENGLIQDVEKNSVCCVVGGNALVGKFYSNAAWQGKLVAIPSQDLILCTHRGSNLSRFQSFVRAVYDATPVPVSADVFMVDSRRLQTVEI